MSTEKTKLPAGGNLAGKGFKANNQRIYAIIALVVIYVFFALFGRNFFSYDTFISILDASYYIGFLAIGVTFVIITGGIDLSIGTVAMCSAIVGGVVWSKLRDLSEAGTIAPLPSWATFSIGLVVILLCGILFGILNGFLVSKLKLPPFIATLGTMMIAKGLSSIVSNVQTINFPARNSELGWFRDIFSKTQLPDGTNLPTGAILLVGTLLIAHVILKKTRIGRYTFAIGSNEEAVRLSGVNVTFWKMIPYIISGLCAAIAGIMFASTYTTIIPGTGQGFELDAIAGVVIGGTSLSGGVGSVFGTLIGVFLMSTLKMGLLSMGLQPHYQILFTGVVVVLAVLMDISQQKKR